MEGDVAVEGGAVADGDDDGAGGPHQAGDGEDRDAGLRRGAAVSSPGTDVKGAWMAGSGPEPFAGGLADRGTTALTSTAGHADHGPHVPRPREDCEEIVWHPPLNVESRPRVLRWTCECRSRVYYLVVGGGRAHIRRSDGPGGPHRETVRMRYHHVERLWFQILRGQAR
jgi:hypothetical protein